MRSSIYTKLAGLFSLILICGVVWGANRIPNLVTNALQITGQSASTVATFDASKNVVSSSITTTQLGLLGSATNSATPSTLVLRDGSGNFNATTATALAATPTGCSAGNFAQSIAASGNLTCAQVGLTTGVSGILPLANGGTGSNLSATGAAHNVLLQSSSGANVTVGQLACSDLSNAAASCSTDATNAGNISSGTLAVNRGGTGQSSYTDGQLLIGNTSTGFLTKAALTAGSGITVTNGNGSITIASSGSSPVLNYTSQTTTYSATISDWVVASGSSFTITLPTAASVAGKSITVQHAGTSLTQVYTIHTTSSQTITNAGTTFTNSDINTNGKVALYTAGEVFVFFSDGSNWQVTQHQTNTSWQGSTTNTIAGSTSNPTKGTTSTDTIKWKREGAFARVRMEYRQTGAGSAGSGDYIFSLPANLTIDTTVLPVHNTIYNATQAVVTSLTIADGACSVESSYPGNGAMLAYSSTQFRLLGVFLNPTPAESYGVIGSSSGGGNLALGVSAIGYFCTGLFPISGWLP